MFLFLYLLVQEDLYQEHYYHDINQGPSWNSHCVFCFLSFIAYLIRHGVFRGEQSMNVAHVLLG